MTGTVLNVAGILIGGVVGLTRRAPMTAANESFFKIVLAVFTVWFGLKLTWLSISGTFLQVLTKLLLMVLALMLGKLLGHFLRLQKFSNKLGRQARDLLERQGAARQPGDGFKACAILFCAAPLGIVGALQDGLHSYFAPLAIKAAIDGLATTSFVKMFGWSPILATLPVLAFQGSLTMLGLVAAPLLSSHGMLDNLNAVAGMLIFSVSLVILGLKKLELADYLPSLLVAPLLARLVN